MRKENQQGSMSCTFGSTGAPGSRCPGSCLMERGAWKPWGRGPDPKNWGGVPESSSGFVLCVTSSRVIPQWASSSTFLGRKLCPSGSTNLQALPPSCQPQGQPRARKAEGHGKVTAGTWSCRLPYRAKQPWKARHSNPSRRGSATSTGLM